MEMKMENENRNLINKRCGNTLLLFFRFYCKVGVRNLPLHELLIRKWHQKCLTCLTI